MRNVAEVWGTLETVEAYLDVRVIKDGEKLLCTRFGVDEVFAAMNECYGAANGSERDLAEWGLIPVIFDRDCVYNVQVLSAPVMPTSFESGGGEAGGCDISQRMTWYPGSGGRDSAGLTL